MRAYTRRLVGAKIDYRNLVKVSEERSSLEIYVNIALGHIEMRSPATGGDHLRARGFRAPGRVDECS
jgi:hypothetical protein